MGACRMFSRGGQIKGLGTKVPAESRSGAPLGVWKRSPQKPTTDCKTNAEIIRLLSVLL